MSYNSFKLTKFPMDSGTSSVKLLLLNSLFIFFK